MHVVRSASYNWCLPLAHLSLEVSVSDREPKKLPLAFSVYAAREAFVLFLADKDGARFESYVDCAESSSVQGFPTYIAFAARLRSAGPVAEVDNRWARSEIGKEHHVW